MKKFLLYLSFSLSFTISYSQPTFDFESWTTMNNGTIAVPEEPSGWVTENQLVSILSPGNDSSIFKVSGTEAHGGLYAMKIKTVKVNNDPTSGQIPNPAGVAYTGKVQISPVKLINGFPYTGRPASCDFWYKYSPITGDSASGSVIFTKWNGTKTDTIGWGGVVIKNAVTGYIQANFSVTYSDLTTFPDTMIVAFSATCWANYTCGKIGSTLWVDDVTFSGWNGINEHASSNDIILFPNPANDFANIIADVNDASAVIVYDVTARIVSSSMLSQSKAGMNRKEGTINTSGLSRGLYCYSVIDKSGIILRAGKFNVVR